MGIKFQAVVFNWKGHEKRAFELEQKLSSLVPTFVINSEDSARALHPNWLHLGENAYFSAQWNKALEIFSADVLLHIQADASCHDFEALISAARKHFESSLVGVYEPHVDFSDIQYNLSAMPAIAPGVYSVPMTDCTCWFISRSVLRHFRPLDLSINRLGWGIPAVVAALAGLNDMHCVRDYSKKISHPKSRGYSTAQAAQERTAYLQSMPSAIRAEAVRRFKLWLQSRPSVRL
jgi:hypothetical protein